MASVFDEKQLLYALEKFGDFIRQSGSGAIPEWTDAFGKGIIDTLHAFDVKLRDRGIPEDQREREVGLAVYAYCELQAFVTGDKSNISNRKEAEVYKEFLAARLEELRKWEVQLA